MNREELIKFRDDFHAKLLYQQKLISKWGWLSLLSFFVGALFILIPAGIVGGEKEKPEYFTIMVIIGIVIIAIGLISLGVFIFRKIKIETFKRFKDSISQELSSMSMRRVEESEKKFKFKK